MAKPLGFFTGGPQRAFYNSPSSDNSAESPAFPAQSDGTQQRQVGDGMRKEGPGYEVMKSVSQIYH